ncbi:F-box protein At1g10780-like isoform X1 [Arachis hypogaea]|uniref:F-box protein At1g10780-like isoform X1 n=2 Tax=Arachis hypogaea TaxID=3818 RepID=UPI000DEC42E1|nr:F-box protein At1g10780-like isoform X2 [Arachis hypogaea]QHO15264.1 F-box protein [Arachis hypogaea]
MSMESLPDALLQYILSHISNARDVAACNCVSKRWKDATTYVRTLYFPRNSFDNPSSGEIPDNIVQRMVSNVVKLEELVVYSPFSPSGLASWLSLVGQSLTQLELRMDNLADNQASRESPSKLDCIGAAKNLVSLKLWGVLMINSPKWDVFQNLSTLEIIGARLEDPVLTVVLLACPYLKRLLLLGCEGVRSISIELPYLEECKLDFYGLGNCSLSLISPKIESLEVQGCSWIRVPETGHLKKLSISNSSGRVYMIDFGNLNVLEFLSMRGVQWCWDAICKMLKLASEVKHLFMKVEFTGDFEALQPFPEIDFVEFFNSHPKLQKFDIHGAMFAALCQRNSLKHVDPGFVIPCLEEAVITVRSPLNAEQKISTLESLLKYGKNLRTMVIKILQMKSCHTSADDFFDEICRLRYMNHEKVRIE